MDCTDVTMVILACITGMMLVVGLIHTAITESIKKALQIMGFVIVTPLSILAVALGIRYIVGLFMDC